jgi:hypothetical protein
MFGVMLKGIHGHDHAWRATWRGAVLGNLRLWLRRPSLRNSGRDGKRAGNDSSRRLCFSLGRRPAVSKQRIGVGQLTSGRSCGNDSAVQRCCQSDRVAWTGGIGAAACQLRRPSACWRSTATCRVRYRFISVVGRVPAPDACIYVQELQ